MGSDFIIDHRGTEYVIWSDNESRVWARVTPKKMPVSETREAKNNVRKKTKNKQSLWNRS